MIKPAKFLLSVVENIGTIPQDMIGQESMYFCISKVGMEE
jgi:hypothetical protein